MEKELLFALISTGIYLVWAIPYWRDLVRGRTTPHLFTYSLWWMLVGFNVFVLVGNNEHYALIPSVLMFASLTWSTIYGIFIWEKIHINWFDWMCLSLWILLVVYWFSSGNILNTVILTLIIDLIAFLPTFKKWWLQPWTETILVYFMSSVGQVFTLLSLSGFENIENMIFWWYLFFANLIFFFMVAIRRYYLKGWKSVFE
jgi:hypothetical protein